MDDDGSLRACAACESSGYVERFGCDTLTKLCRLFICNQLIEMTVANDTQSEFPEIQGVVLAGYCSVRAPPYPLANGVELAHVDGVVEWVLRLEPVQISDHER